MNATNKTLSFGKILLSHACLLGAIGIDFLRRGSDGILTTMFSAFSLVMLIMGGIFFFRHPHLFFFVSKNTVSSQKQISILIRIFAWLFVTLVPVLWMLVGIDFLARITSDELMKRIIGSYMFFAYIAAAIILTPCLFTRKN